MKLTIKERIITQAIIIKQGGLIELTLAKSLVNKTMFTAKEIADYEMKDTADGAQWNPHKETEPKDFDFTKEEIEILKKSVKIKDEEQQLHIDMIDFCNRILEV